MSGLRSFDPARAPAVSLLTVAAVAVFVGGLAGRSPDSLVLDVRAFMGEPWRIVTTALPHANAIHLAFNLIWLVRLGAPIERQLGTVRFLLLAILLGGGAALAEYALGATGVGLSGVGYGLVGFGWVARHDPRFAGLVDRRTALLFIGWFFFCIGATLIDFLPVANVAHAVGAILGALIGGFVVARTAVRRIGSIVVGATLLVASWLGATTFRPRVNFTASRGQDAAYLGWKLLDAAADADAEPYLREAVRVAPHRSDWWFNLAIACSRQNKEDDALAAYRRARDTAPGDSSRAEALAGALQNAGFTALEAGDFDRARALCAEGEATGFHDLLLGRCLTMADRGQKWPVQDAD